MNKTEILPSILLVLFLIVSFWRCSYLLKKVKRKNLEEDERPFYQLPDVLFQQNPNTIAQDMEVNSVPVQSVSLFTKIILWLLILLMAFIPFQFLLNIPFCFF